MASPFNYTAIYTFEYLRPFLEDLETRNWRILFLKEVGGSWEETVVDTFSENRYGDIILAQNYGEDLFLIVAEVGSSWLVFYRSEDGGDTW